MSIKKINVPTVGESISEVTVGRWSKNNGDYVNAEEVICELESDKATFEVTAESSGILTIKAKEGDVLPIGGLIGEIESKSGGAETTVKKEEAPKSKASGEVIEMKVPTVGESISEVTIGKWNKNDGDIVQAEEVICELESDKATFELNAATTGILKILAKSGDVIPIGGLVCAITATNEAPSISKTKNNSA